MFKADSKQGRSLNEPDNYTLAKRNKKSNRSGFITESGELGSSPALWFGLGAAKRSGTCAVAARQDMSMGFSGVGSE
jgi:hypothetical protein